MAPKLSSDRRTFVKWAVALPLFGQIAAQDVFGKTQTGIRKLTGNRIPTYQDLGVRTLINARGTWTYLSASLELPEVKQAQLEAAKHFVDIVELQHAVGRRLAELSGAESGMVTSGAAGAMASATAGCIAGTDPQKIWQLPDTTGMKDQVIMFGGRTAFDSAIRLAGGKLVVAHSHEELQNAMNNMTAMVYTTALGDELKKALEITKRAGVPLLLDDAAGIPPISNLKLYSQMGCDLYCFSGGKGLLGPQCSGLLIGRKDLIEAALANTNPWEGAVCRPMKVGKEEIMGCLAAVEAWTKLDTDILYRQWDARVKRIAKLIETVPGVKTTIYVPKGGNRYPTLRVTWDQETWKFSVQDCAKKLSEGEPRIEVLTASNPSGVLARLNKNFTEPGAENHLEIISMSLQRGEDLIVGKRLREVLTAARKSA
ncbi:MAG: aminotransferase class V-fold PLP-dependent enzyme [Acidobacteria bacterium]|nr:MAG: aminotransferase class V-fold PLP-dependent enzyme [Acidobacteriota bacterium]